MRDVRACASCVSLRASALASGTAAARPLSATVYRPRACTLLALAVGVRLGGGYPRSVPGHTAAEVRSLGGAPSAARCANLQAVVLSSLVETEPARSAAPLVTTTHSSSVGLSGWRPRRLAARRKQLSIRAVADATTAPTRKPAAAKPAATKPAATKPAAKKAARPKAALPKAAPRAKAAPKKPAAGGAAAQGRAQGRARGRGRGRGRGGRGGRGRGGRGKTDQQALTPTRTLTLTLILTLTLTLTLILTLTLP